MPASGWLRHPAICTSTHQYTCPSSAFRRTERSAARKDGYAIHLYACSASMGDSCLANADGDFLIVPQLVSLAIVVIVPHTPGQTLWEEQWRVACSMGLKVFV